MHGQLGNLHRLAGRRETVELPTLRACRSEAGHDEIAFGHDLPDVLVPVGEGSAMLLDRRLESLAPFPFDPGDEVADEVRGIQFIRRRQIALASHLGVGAAQESFVAFEDGVS